MKRDVWNALSSKIRRDIIHLLGNKNLSAGEIANQFSLTKATISHHLAILKEVELVQIEKDKNSIIYSLNNEVMDELTNDFYFISSRREKHS